VRKHWKLLVVFVGLALAVAGMISTREKAEPIYKDRPLTQWCLQYKEYKRGQDGPSEIKKNEALDAMRAIGTNGIPIALGMLRAEISSRAKLARQLRRIPHLEHVLRYSWCLAAIGRPSIPTLLAALSRPEIDYRDQITCWLASDDFDFGTNINQAAPILVKLINDPNPMVAVQSVKALGRMTTDTVLLLPTLTNALQHPNPAVRSAAALSLSRLPGGKSAVVRVLHAALVDPAERTRLEATNTLRMIAPEALTNAPPE
jgi:hypothetical protein